MPKLSEAYLTADIGGRYYAGMPKVDMYKLDPDALDRARRARLLTIGELEQAARCGNKSLWRARRGEAIGLPLAKRVAKALRAPLRDLLAGEPAAGEPDNTEAGEA